MAGRDWTTAEVIETLAVYAEHGSSAASTLNGRSKQYIQRLARDRGIRRDRSIYTPRFGGLAEKVSAMLLDGPVSTYDVAESLGCTPAAARQCLGRLARSGRVVRYGPNENRLFRLADCNR